MTDVNCYYRKGQKRNVTKVEISGAAKTYIVILSNLKRVPKQLSLKSTKDYVSRDHENNSSILDLENTNITVVVHKNKSDNEKIRNHHKYRTPFVTTDEYLKIMAKKRSTPDVHVEAYNETRRTKKQRSDTYLNASTSFRTQCIINTMTLDPTKVPEEYLALLRHPLVQAQLRIYRHHFNEKKETCYRYCKSMTNLMKSLYDSHKEKHFNQYDIEDQNFSKTCDLPEIEVRETEDSIFINTFAATAISDQKEEVIGVSNLNLLQPKATIQQNYKSCTKLLENKALIKNEVCMNRDMLLAKFKITTSENLYEIKTAKSQKCKPQSETTIALYRAFSFNDIICLSGNAKLKNEGIDILVKKFDHVCDKQLINSAKNEYYSKALRTEVIAPIYEKGIQPLSEHIIKPEKSEIIKEVNTKISPKKCSSETLHRTGSASILIENSFDQNEHLHQSFKRHSFSLQEFKITLEKNIIETMTKDFVIFSKISNLALKEIKANELDGATTLEKSLVNKVVETTSLDHLNSSPMEKEIVLNQSNEVIEQEKKDKEHELCKDSATYCVKPLEIMTKPNIPLKQNEGTSIPVLIHKKTQRKKHVEFKDDPTFLNSTCISTFSETTPSKAEYAKHQTNASSTNQKSALKKEKVLKPFLKMGESLMNEGDISERGIFYEKKGDITLTERKKIGKLPIEMAPQNNGFNNTIYSIFNSQVGQVKRRSKSLIDKPQESKELLKRQAQAKNKSVSVEVRSKSESETTWDKVLSKKIRDVLDVPKKPDVKLRIDRNSSFRYPAIDGNKTVQRGKVINASQIKEGKDLATSPKTFTKNEEYPKVQLSKQFTSLDGKTALEKEKILRALIKKGKPLPEGRSKAEKTLIDRVKAEAISKGRSSVTAPTVRKNK